MGRKPKDKIDAIRIVQNIQGRTDITVDEIIKICSSKFKQLNSKEMKEKNHFKSEQELADWWGKQFAVQDGKCCYCKTKISDIQKLINSSLLKTRRVGRNATGERGRQFEVERMDAEGNYYSPSNCKLACYYCNNDKSYIFPADDFENFMGKSKGEYFKYLLTKI